MSIGPSPSMRYCLLRPSGELTDERGNAVRRLGPGRLLLSRALLRFARVAPPIDLPASLRAKAALTFADSNAPFAQSESFILRSGDGFSVWWWDRDLVRTLLAPFGGASWRPLAPETIFVEPDNSWRHLALADGYEAQAWRDGALLASSWRPTPFGNEAWSSFLLTVDDAAAPSDPPEPTAPVMRESQNLREQTVRRGVGAAEATAAMALLGAAGLACAAFFAGQAMRASHEADRLVISAAGVTATASTANADAGRRYIADYEALTQSGDVSEVAAMVLGSARRENLTVLRWTLDDGQLRVRMASSEPPAAISAFLADIEASDASEDVVVRSAADGEQIEIGARIVRRRSGA